VEDGRFDLGEGGMLQIVKTVCLDYDSNVAKRLFDAHVLEATTGLKQAAQHR
jgi:hypothetical protein